MGLKLRIKLTFLWRIPKIPIRSVNAIITNFNVKQKKLFRIKIRSKGKETIVLIQKYRNITFYFKKCKFLILFLLESKLYTQS